MNIFNSIYYESFPVIKAKRKYRNHLPLLGTGLKESIKGKNKLFRISLNTILPTMLLDIENIEII